MIKSLIVFINLLLFTQIPFSQIKEEWTARYSYSGNSIDAGRKILLDENNNVYVTGGSFSDFATIKYNSNGKLQWIRRYGGSGTDIPNDMIIDTKGNIYITGGSDFNSERKDFVTIKYSPEGNEMWVNRYPCIGNENFSTSIISDSLNNIYITGKNFQFFTTIKYNSDGIQMWVAEYPVQVYNDIPWDIALDDSLNVYIAGQYNSDCITIKYNNNGIQQWVSTYNGKSNEVDFNLLIGIDKNSNVYVSGRSIQSSNHIGGYVTIKYDQNGIQQWVRIYEGTANFFDIPEEMKVDKSGNVYVTGYSTESGQGYNFTTIKYNTNGDTLWKASYHNGSNDIARDIKIDNLGNVYVTGKSDGNGTGDDYATVKYDSLGNQLWVMRYDYSGQYGDYPSSITLDKNGSVFVTGQSNRDFLTIKYSQLTGTSTIFSEIPTQYSLSQNYPNPFNPKTVISYELRVTSDAELKVFDVLGNEVAELVNEKQNAGSFSVEFDGSGFASGIYFYSLITDGVIIDTKRMILLK